MPYLPQYSLTVPNGLQSLHPNDQSLVNDYLHGKPLYSPPVFTSEEPQNKAEESETCSKPHRYR